VLNFLNRLSADSSIRYQNWSVRLFSSDSLDDERVLPREQRYQLQPGPGKADGIKVTALMGMPREVVDLAKEIYRKLP